MPFGKLMANRGDEETPRDKTLLLEPDIEDVSVETVERAEMTKVSIHARSFECGHWNNGATKAVATRPERRYPFHLLCTPNRRSSLLKTSFRATQP